MSAPCGTHHRLCRAAYRLSPSAKLCTLAVCGRYIQGHGMETLDKPSERRSGVPWLLALCFRRVFSAWKESFCQGRSTAEEATFYQSTMLQSLTQSRAESEKDDESANGTLLYFESQVYSDTPPGMAAGMLTLPDYVSWLLVSTSALVVSLRARARIEPHDQGFTAKAALTYFNQGKPWILRKQGRCGVWR